MTDQIHIVPVGFDNERLYQPISRGKLDADKVYLLHSSREESKEQARELADSMLNELEQIFDNVLGVEKEVREVSDIFDFEEAYSYAYNLIIGELEKGNEVWINISSMPRTVAFGFATAANTISIEVEDFREQVHTYYVSPERYLVTEMIQQLKKEKQFLEDYSDEADKFQERLNQISDLVSRVEQKGVTEGAKEMNGDLHVEFPPVPSSQIEGFERELLFMIDRFESPESITDLAKKVAEETGEDPDSIKSKVLYNVNELQEKGFIQLKKESNRHKPRVSQIGKLWLKTHENSE